WHRLHSMARINHLKILVQRLNDPRALRGGADDDVVSPARGLPVLSAGLSILVSTVEGFAAGTCAQHHMLDFQRCLSFVRTERRSYVRPIRQTAEHASFHEPKVRGRQLPKDL